MRLGYATNAAPRRGQAPASRSGGGPGPWLCPRVAASGAQSAARNGTGRAKSGRQPSPRAVDAEWALAAPRNDMSVQQQLAALQARLATPGAGALVARRPSMPPAEAQLLLRLGESERTRLEALLSCEQLTRRMEGLPKADASRQQLERQLASAQAAANDAAAASAALREELAALRGGGGAGGPPPPGKGQGRGGQQPGGEREWLQGGEASEALRQAVSGGQQREQQQGEQAPGSSGGSTAGQEASPAAQQRPTASTTTIAAAHVSASGSGAEPAGGASSSGKGSASGSNGNGVQAGTVEQGSGEQETELRYELDVLNQRLYAMQMRLSATESERAMLAARLQEADAELHDASARLVEHSQLQMEHDQACHDIYKLRARLQRLQAAKLSTAEARAAVQQDAKQHLDWLMSEHREELGRMHEQNMELWEEVSALRVRLVEEQEAVWRLQNTDSYEDGAQLAGAEAAALQQELVALQGQLQDAARQRAAMEVEMQQLREEMQGGDAARMQASALQQEKGELLKQLAALQQQAAEAQAQLAALPVQQLKQQAAQAQAEASEAREAAAAAQAALAVVEGEQRLLRGELVQARYQATDLKQQLGAVQAAFDVARQAFEQQLSDVRRWYGRQTRVAAALRRAPDPAQHLDLVGHVSVNRYWVPGELMFEFFKCWAGREAAMSEAPGFLGLHIVQDDSPLDGDEHADAASLQGGVVVRVSGLWESPAEWHAWCSGPVGRRTQDLPEGVKQFKPRRGEAGLPEDFVPFVT